MFLYNYLIHPIENVYRVVYLFLAEWFGNYGIAVVALSLLSFLVLYPFTRRAHQIQQEELHLQKILQEQLKSIKANYSGVEQFEKIQRLYSRYSYHPIMVVRSVIGLLIQLPFLLAVFYMLSKCAEIQGVSWVIIPNLGTPDHLLDGINVLPFVMTLVTVIYAFVMPEISQKERLQTIAIGFFFLFLLYNSPSALLIFWTCNLLCSLLDSLISKKLECIGNLVSENELVFHIGIALSLTVGLLVPTEIYIKNASQLWFDFKDILKYFIADTVKCFVALLLIYILCWRKKIRGVFLSVLSGLLIAVFLQSYIMGINYGMFDGREIKWDKYKCTGLVNSFIWLFCLGGLYTIFKRCAFNEEKIKRFLKPVSFGIVAMQCVVLLITLKNNPIQKDIVLENGKTGVLTSKNLYTVSSKDNIVVFLLDAFDASIFEEIQQNNPEVLNELKDFVFYPDTTSSYGYTYYSLPEILTGTMYELQNSYSEYLQKAWKETPYFRFLTKNNYLVDLYTSGRYVVDDTQIDNLTLETIKLNNNMVEYFEALARFRMAPHYLKKLFYQYQHDILNSAVLNTNYRPYEENDRAFFMNLRKKFEIKNGINFFKFYHLSGMHEPFVLNENAELVNHGDSSYYKQAIGCLKIVKDYMNLMKQHKIYDNATIVIMADHGTHNEIGSRPLFLVKQPGIINNSLAVNDSPMRIGALMPIVFQRFKGFNENKFDVLDDNDNRFYYFEIDKHFIKYYVKSPASNIHSWIPLGKVKHNLVMDRKYEIGDVIDFSFDGNSRKYKNNGWREKEDWEGTYIYGREADIVLDLQEMENIKGRVIVLVRSGAYLKKKEFRKVSMLVNDRLVKSWEFKNNTIENMYFQGGYNCEIPKELLIKKTPLKVKFLTDGRDQDSDISKFDQTILIKKFQIRIEP